MWPESLLSTYVHAQWLHVRSSVITEVFPQEYKHIFIIQQTYIKHVSIRPPSLRPILAVA